jgi:P4 family phage/plasmid primase-like protien
MVQQTKTTVKDAAIEYAKRGWSSIPVPYRSKAPVLDAWQNLRLTAETLGDYFNGRPQNIGVLLGEPSGWLIDVDLDHPYAVEERENFLPATGLMFGRTSKPLSHLLYQATAPVATHQRKLPGVGMIVELRSTGGQTVFPPSVHEKGESIEWHTYGEPLLIAPEELRACVDALADRVTQRLGIDPTTVPAKTTTGKAAPPDVTDRAARYIAKIPGAISGQGGHDQTFHVACVLVLGFALTPDQAYPLLVEYNEKCQPPWSDKELRHKLDDANRQGGPRGHLLDDKPADPPRREYHKPEAKPDVGTQTVFYAPEAIDDPHRLARLILPNDGSVLRWHRDQWYAFDDYAYRPVESSEIRAKVTAGIKEEFDLHAASRAAADPSKPPPTCKKVTGRVASDTMRALESLALLPGKIEPPAWIGEDSPPWPAAESVVTRSGIVHIPSVGTDRAVTPCTPALFTTNVLPYGYEPAADCPAWLEFLGSLLSDDPESIDTLQEWFGLSLVPDTRHHKLLMLIGPPRSGKGTIARVLRGMIGIQNLCSPTLSSLAGPFGLWPLVGKLVALIADARLSGRTDAIAVVERLLSISGEDPQDVARKNLPTLAGIRLPTRFVIMSNELPNMRDASGALLTRVILIRLTRSFTGREDRTLGDRLLSELPGVLNWAIRGLQRLRTRGYFVQPASGQELLDDLSEMASPISAFVGERCLLGAEYSVAIDDLFVAWQTWCQEHGRDHPGTQQTFGRDLRAARPELKVSNRRILNTRARYYEGITLRPDM